MPAPQLQTYGPADVHVYLDSTPTATADGTPQEVSLPIQSFGDFSVDEMMFDSARGFGQRWQSALPLGVAEVGELSLDLLVDTRENSIDSVLGAPELMTPRTRTRTLRVTWGPRSGAGSITRSVSDQPPKINFSAGYKENEATGTLPRAVVYDGASAVSLSGNQYVSINGHAYVLSGTPTTTGLTLTRGAGANRTRILGNIDDDAVVDVITSHFREVEGWIKGRTLKLDRDNLQMWTVAFQPTDEVVGSA